MPRVATKPVTKPRKPLVDSREFRPLESEFTLNTTGDVIRPDPPEIIVADGPLPSEYQAELAFMEEVLLVQVLTTNDKDAVPMPHVAVNGVNQYFVRGQPTRCKRKFVEVLARSKPEAIRTNVTVQSVGAEPVNSFLRSSAPMYQFQVLEDKNPKGTAWLSKLLQET